MLGSPCELSEPGFESCLAESCVIARKQGPLADLCPGVKRFGVSDDFTGIFEFGQPSPNQFIQAKLLRASNFDDTVYRRAYCNPCHGTRDIVSSHRLEKHMGQMHLAVFDGNIGKALEELKELRCMHDRIRDG